MESRSTHVTWLLAAIVVWSGGRPGIAQRRQEPAAIQPAKASILAAAVYASDQGPRQLTLWRRDLEAAPMTTVLQYLQRHPDRMSLPNVALYVVDTAADSPLTGRVAWVSYDYLAPEMVQRPQWSADVLVHPLTADVYVAVLKSAVVHATLSLYQVRRGASLAAFPLDLSVARIEQWPQGPGAVARFEKDVADAPACGAASVRIAATPAGLFAVVLRERPACPPVYLEYDSAAKAWHESAVSRIPR